MALTAYYVEEIDEYVEEFISCEFRMGENYVEDGYRCVCVLVDFKDDTFYVWVDINLSTLEWEFNQYIFDLNNVFDVILEKAFKRGKFIEKIDYFLSENNCFAEEEE